MVEMRIQKQPEEASIPEILDAVFRVIDETERHDDDVVVWNTNNFERTSSILFLSLLLSYKQISDKTIIFDCEETKDFIIELKQSEIESPQRIKDLEQRLRNEPLYNSQLSTAITYLVDELFCNIQQHSLCKKFLICLALNKSQHCIDICISDNGISLYGSYVKSGRYTGQLGNESVSALYLAKDGFSTKNLPDAENRGYGISSNLKMVVKGLKGDFSLISGNALYLNLKSKEMLVGLPEQIDWQGTTIVARLPLTIDGHFSLYDYIS